VPQACRDTDGGAKASVSRRDMSTMIPDFGIMFWNLERNGLSLRMRIFTEQALSEYIQKHPETKTALQEWKYVVRHSEWTCFADIKKDFNSVDAVGNQRYVFNIMGNHHRIVVVIKFTIYFVYIRFIGTHTEYERMNKTIGAKNI
jgi:mRNA interferase HigB